MPQMAIIQPAPPKGPPQSQKAGSTDNQQQNAFSPHLDQAVSRNKQPQADNRRATASAKTTTDDTAAPNVQLSPATESENSPDILGTAEPTGLPDLVNEKDVLLAEGMAALQKITVTADTVLITQQSKTGAQQLGNLLNGAAKSGAAKKILSPKALPATGESTSIKPGEQQLGNLLSSAAEKILSPKALPVAVDSTNVKGLTAPTDTNGDKAPAAKAQTILLDQLQRIIDQSDETGIVSITKAKNCTPAAAIGSMRVNMHGVLLPTNPQNLPSPAAALLVAAPEAGGQALTRASQLVTPDSQDLRQHFFTPKIASTEPGDARKNFQEQTQGDALMQQNSGSGFKNSPSSGLSSTMEQGNTFSQIVTAIPQPTSQTVEAPERAILLPSGVIVQEDDILQQLSHKMQLSSKNMETRINLKLHPAELGSLKIDLTVKEGSIRANVIAQSQHTTELLEKNMTKLKTILENQGYSVDEMSITTESDSVSDFNHFDRQLFSRHDTPQKFSKTGADSEAVFSLPDTFFAAPAISTGVNVKI